MDTKNKLRLAALFISTSIIILALSYFIAKEITVSIYFFILIIITSTVIGILISRIKNPYLVKHFVNMLYWIPRFDEIENNQLNARQVKNKKIDDFIKSRPVLHALVIILIMVVSGIFITALCLQILQLMK